MPHTPGTTGRSRTQPDAAGRSWARGARGGVEARLLGQLRHVHVGVRHGAEELCVCGGEAKASGESAGVK